MLAFRTVAENRPRKRERRLQPPLSRSAHRGAQDPQIVAAGDLRRFGGRKAAAQHRRDLHGSKISRLARRHANCRGVGAADRIGNLKLEIYEAPALKPVASRRVRSNSFAARTSCSTRCASASAAARRRARSKWLRSRHWRPTPRSSRGRGAAGSQSRGGYCTCYAVIPSGTTSRCPIRIGRGGAAPRTHRPGAGDGVLRA
jgi:hypothetical protein